MAPFFRDSNYTGEVPPMPTENKPAEPLPSLATGADLDAATWNDFVERLRHDCNRAGAF
jgi:hypothetical protein